MVLLQSSIVCFYLESQINNESFKLSLQMFLMKMKCQTQRDNSLVLPYCEYVAHIFDKNVEESTSAFCFAI